ncbi:hypothetical protein [Leadbettera azotonutricia]|uniref:Uncharacterized protein n=1 Tax=Leadbettera azotonutricia (strain ATCC BAA-888 / DSM 13862 / ZAS-9) TaxID=545695 RepID=F5YFT6_LEAAZ|nr:hypothetical protein [Leadbettera azotonutricia]AEF81718.1 hypothetical protein TREAZ_2431 [Leadbettera azotonutricia ZAS-9]
MKNIVIHILISIGFSFLIVQFQKIMDSQYLTEYLKGNLITIIIALLAINTATLGIILSRIREIINNLKQDYFINTKKQMLSSITEQIILVIISIIFFIINDSNWLIKNSEYRELIDTFCISLFIYDLIILYDTSKSIFIIVNFKNNNKADN